jgi:endoglucanase
MRHTGAGLAFIFLFLGCACDGQRAPASIQCNQIGFYPGSSKIAVVMGETSADDFYIISEQKKDTVYKGRLGGSRRSANSSVSTRIADFTPVRKKGNYFISVPGATASFVFQIKEDVYHGLTAAVLKGFYYQRSNMPLEKKYAGKWNRPAGHPDDVVYVHPSAASALRPADAVIASPGGWYDAGDYNKYIVNSGITMGTLLSAYEDFSKYCSGLRVNIPESGDKVPDILNEALYNLRWMLTMQDTDGGVYHKCTNAAFDGMVMPGVTREKRYVVQKSTAATLDFAAVMAQAARIFKNFRGQLPRLSDSCLKAAASAWDWAVKNPSAIYNQKKLNEKFDPDITTGDYGDAFLDDEWLWAAAELFATTKKKMYFNIVEQRMGDFVQLPSWANVSMLGYYSMIRLRKDLPAVAAPAVRTMTETLIKMANDYIAKRSSVAFATVMGESRRDFVWGSNAVAANEGILLVNAYLLKKNKDYLEGAFSNLDYILGRNATGYCFVTGLGSRSPMHPHHRPSVADGIVEPVPGLLAGGPNPGRQDHCAYPFTEPETAYVDSDCAYAANEIAINWNAPMVYLAVALSATGQKNIGR